MTQEEKARAYDEALEKATTYYDNAKEAGDHSAVARYENMFPELIESEDEKIIGEIKFAIMQMPSSRQDTKNRCLAWLEKQKGNQYFVGYVNGYSEGQLNPKQKEQKPKTIKEYHEAFDKLYGDYEPDLQPIEQKPAESISQLTVQGKGVYKICPRCKERMVRDDSKVYTSMPPQYGYECPKCGEIEFDTVMYDNPEMKEQKPWKVGANAYFTPVQKPIEYLDKDKIYAIMNKLHELAFSQLIPINSDEYKKIDEITTDVRDLLDYPIEQKLVEWSEDDKKMLQSIICEVIDEGMNPTKEQVNWLKSLRPQPKEEDCNYITPNKEFFQWIYDRLVHVHKENPDVDYMRSFRERINNLSFEDKHHWRPSEEQMIELRAAISGCSFDTKTLSSLEKDLKKLM